MMDRTLEAVQKQVRAMAAEDFEVGLFKPAVEMPSEPEMLPRVWNAENLIKSVSWLKFQNRKGRNIYIRPKGEHRLSLVDDLPAETLEKMKASGFTPALIVETSPGNFQAWLNHGRVLSRNVSSAAARSLAEQFEGDRGSADWRHYGRLAGFTNRKEKHRREDGHFPFVRLVHAGGDVYPKANEFIHCIGAQVELAQREADRRRMRSNNRFRQDLNLKTIDHFRRDPRYGGDGNRIDLAYAVYALSHGVPEEQVRIAIASRDLKHKGNEKRQADYVDRTIQKALLAFRDVGLSR
jgi:RepB DNA-primase from phage plasmid